MAGPILDSQGHACDFSEKGQKKIKRAKYLKIWAKIYKIWKYIEKGQVIACDYRTQQPARKGLEWTKFQVFRVRFCFFLGISSGVKWSPFFLIKKSARFRIKQQVPKINKIHLTKYITKPQREDSLNNDKNNHNNHKPLPLKTIPLPLSQTKTFISRNFFSVNKKNHMLLICHCNIKQTWLPRLINNLISTFL